MKNPWNNLPQAMPFVLRCDLDVVNAFNDRHAERPDVVLQTHLLPEPFFGRRSSRVYVLGLNPGYSPADDHWHANIEFADAIRKNLIHGKLECPHYYLDPRFADSPGAGWWQRKCKWLIEDCGLECIAANFFCVELFPYHSHKYTPVPVSISASGLAPSTSYTAYLLREAMAGGKLIIAMRAYAAWSRLVPELATYPRLFRLNSPQNVALSPNNLVGYDEVVAELKRVG